MNEDWDKKLKQAKEDHERMESSYAIAKQKHEKLQGSINQLKHKYQELQLAIEEQKKKLERTIKTSLQQQNKVSLAELAAEGKIQECMQKLLVDNETQQNCDDAIMSTSEQTEEYNQLTEAIEQNKQILLDLLKRVENIQNNAQEN